MASDERFVPVTEDLRLPDQRFDIVKGLEIVTQMLADKKLADGETAEQGKWMVLNDSDELVTPTTTAVANCFPVWSGTEGFDSKATGAATVIMGGGYRVQTNMYVAGSYANGQALTVKNTDGKLEAAAGSDPVVARVVKVPGADNVMEVLVTNR